MVYVKKAWAQKNKHIHYSEAARILGVSVQSIYNWREEKNSDNLNLFEAKK
jgi:transposase-like protein